ncbi:uncharacterized protein LOC124119575 [Haliotis rufescens]|uniref:uncharacterized protein LOC124119575 n=1 Tax=Haliotis rufescens TaxID=6454 RepID=UPI00201F5EE4|nr:uncharacterized protein LOC124119575 [Haliotis rufescens]XP_048249336.1 uncharacterized protein LOC124119575 [Haliotis rufescens]
MASQDKHGEQNLSLESPAASSKQLIGRRKSGMRLELLEPDDDDDMLEEGSTASRRPSTCSLSRFRSCPQLAAVAQEQISPGMDVVSLDDDAAATASPTLRQRLHIEDLDRRSTTPTPPSTPGSRRSHLSLKESSNRVSGLSPTSTPKLSRRSMRDFKHVGRTSSGDSATQDHMSFSSTGVQISLRDENVLRSDDFSDRFSKPQSDMFEGPPEINIEDRLSDIEDSERPSSAQHRYHHHHSHHAVSDDSHDKCQRWLQSLKITRADRIKSRSHIQLPPI